jgi:formate dehydrogenase subunit gamma
MDSDTIDTLVREAAATHGSEREALLPVLHQVQEALGYIPEQAVPAIARTLNLSRADVHGVISFYHYFRSIPGGDRTLYICRAESCQAMGSAALEARARAALGIDYHQTSSDGRFSLEPVYCLGNCACSPSVMVDDSLYSRVTPASLDEILES